MDGDQLVVNIVNKGSSISHNRLPYLTFESKGFRSSIVQDVPISEPLGRADVADIQAALDLAQTLPQTLVQVRLLMMFQYFIPGTRQTDNSLSLHYRLPILDDT
ncbi:unnamed protein product [Calypogeia fissa]